MTKKNLAKILSIGGILVGGVAVFTLLGRIAGHYSGVATLSNAMKNPQEYISHAREIGTYIGAGFGVLADGFYLIIASVAKHANKTKINIKPTKRDEDDEDRDDDDRSRPYYSYRIT